MKYWTFSLFLCLISIGLVSQPYLYEPLEIDGPGIKSIVDVGEADNGDLWVLFYNGVLHKSAADGSFTYHLVDSVKDFSGNYQLLKMKMLEVLNGRPWVVSQDNGVYYLENDQWMKLGGSAGLSLDEINGLTAAANGDIWLAGEKGIARFDFTDVEMHYPVSWQARAPFIQSSGGRIYTLTANQLLFYEGGTWQQYAVLPDSVSPSWFNGMYVDPDAKVFLTSKSPRHPHHYRFDGGQWVSLETRTTGMLVGRDKDLYIMSGDGALYTYENSEKFLQQYPRASMAKVTTFRASADGGFWLAVGDNVLVKAKVADVHNYAELSVNQLIAGISSNGSLFENGNVPVADHRRVGNLRPRWADTASFMNNGNLWIKADIDGTPYVSANTWRSPQSDFASGPLSENYDMEYLTTYDRVWNVSKAEIKKHIAEIFSQGYKIPEAILNWPAHGRLKTGEAEHLAPFVDVNGNGLYEPQLGDHPNIKGDEAIYFIINDQRSYYLETHSPGVGVEIHGMIYAFGSENADLANSVFLSYQVFNRSGQSMKNVKTSLWADHVIGAYDSDLVGCDSTLGMVYSYNGDNDDQGACGFGVNPPALGFLPLSESLTGSINYFYQTSAYQGQEPYSGHHYRQYMDILWRDTSRVYIETPDGILGNRNGDGYSPGGAGSLTPTRFQYNDQVNWYMSPTSRNGGTIGSFETHELEDGESFCLELAFTTARGSDHLASLADLKDRGGRLKNIYRQWESSCPQLVAAFQGPAGEPVSIYPNPAHNQLTLLVPENQELVRSAIFSISGQKLAEFEREAILNIYDLPPGAYVLQCETNTGVSAFRFLKQ